MGVGEEEGGRGRRGEGRGGRRCVWCNAVWCVCGVGWVWVSGGVEEEGEEEGGERRVVVVVVVVVVLMVCIDDVSVHATKCHAPNSGEPCPCGHDPPGPAPVCRALKSHPISSSSR